MMLQVDPRDLRAMIWDKCNEIISDEKVANAFYCRMCEIEDDDRFMSSNDFPKVVRCKDCKHAERVGGCGYRCFMWEYNAVQDEGFCNYGERRES